MSSGREGNLGIPSNSVEKLRHHWITKAVYEFHVDLNWFSMDQLSENGRHINVSVSSVAAIAQPRYTEMASNVFRNGPVIRGISVQ
jgi:hypothetical protein